MPPTLPGTVCYPARPGSKSLTAEALWAIPRVGTPAPLPDGRAAIVPVTRYALGEAEGKTRLWLVPADGGEPRALTAPDVSASAPVPSPDGKRLAFLRKGGNGKSQLHVLPLDGGESQALTTLPLGVSDARWLPDGTGLVIAAALFRGHATPEATATEATRREKDPVKAHATEDRIYRYWDRWLTTGETIHMFHVDAKTGATRDLDPTLAVWFDWMEPRGRFDISPDGREVAFEGAFVDAKGLLRSGLHTVPVAGGTATCLTTANSADDGWPRYTPDGKGIVYGHTEDPLFYADRTRLLRYDRASRTHAPFLADWDLSPSQWEFADARTLVFHAEQDGRTHAFAWDGTGKPRILAKGGTITATAPSRDGRVWLSASTLQDPPEVHAVALAGGEMRRCTRFTADATRDLALGEAREMRVEGAKGVPVQVWLVLPPGHRAGTPAPLLHVIHGGPHGITPDGFHFRWNAHLFGAPGYAVACVNFQGSTSWGQDFAQRIQGSWGDRPTADVLAATDALVAAGVADPARMAIAGGSYGGYLVAWLTTQTTRFRCAINHAGVFDLLAQYGSDVTQGRARSFGGDAWAGLDAVDRWSPARHMRDVTTPTLIIHGERDYRVPVGHALEAYGILKAKGVPARLLYFPDENHWILKPDNSVRWYREVHEWLARFLGNLPKTESR